MTHITRRDALALAGLGGMPWLASATEPYPNGPIRVVVPYPPGAATDNLARLLAQSLERELGVNVIVENKGGASTQIGTKSVADAKPDGQTLGFVDTSFVINPGLFGSSLPYDTLRDFQPVSQMAMASLVFIVHNSVPAKTIQEFLSLARQDPSRFNFGSAGSGSAPHLAGEQLRQVAGIEIGHIPYRGGSTVINDLIAGHVQSGFTTVPTMAAHIRSGAVRALFVTSPERSPQLSDVPTSKEVGLAGVDLMPIFGLIAPARVPAAVITRLSDAASTLVKSADLNKRLRDLGFIPVGSSASEFTSRVRSESAKWTEIIRTRKIRPNT